MYISKEHKINEYLQSLGYEPLNQSMSILELLKRPKVELRILLSFFDMKVDSEIIKQIEIETKYAGYIEKAKKEANRLLSMEKIVLPLDIDYNDVIHLSLEARQKLNDIKPLNIGQASRISGVNPADIAVLAVYLQSRGKNNSK